MRCSGRRASSGCEATCSSDPAAAATSASKPRKAALYGREASTRSWARRSFAAETIFMALVICCVFRTERMRRRISIRLGMRGGRLLGYEALFEFLQHCMDFSAQGIVEDLLFYNLGHQRAMGVIHEPVHLLFELTDLFDRKIIQVTLRAGEDDEDLLLYR